MLVLWSPIDDFICLTKIQNFPDTCSLTNTNIFNNKKLLFGYFLCGSLRQVCLRQSLTITWRSGCTLYSSPALGSWMCKNDYYIHLINEMLTHKKTKQKLTMPSWGLSKAIPCISITSQILLLCQYGNQYCKTILIQNWQKAIVMRLIKSRSPVRAINIV